MACTASAEATAAAEAAAFGDRIREVMKIIDVLRGFDITKITQLFSLIEQISAAGPLRDKVRLGIEALTLIAEMTPTAADDKLLASIRGVLTDEVLDVLVRIISGMLGQMSAQDVTLTAKDKATAAAANIPWSLLIQIALQLLPLLQEVVKPKS